MKTQDFSITVTVDQSPKVVFDAINNVSGWWSEEVQGNSQKLNDEFTYHYRDVHSCRMKLIEVIPEKKVVWLVLENDFNFTTDKTEWVGTKVIFEISRQDNKTQIHFTHEGLVPAYECYDACVNGWTRYLQGSLVDLIKTGKGQPNPKETVPQA
jgi:hypothetical protein